MGNLYVVNGRNASFQSLDVVSDLNQSALISSANIPHDALAQFNSIVNFKPPIPVDSLRSDTRLSNTNDRFVLAQTSVDTTIAKQRAALERLINATSKATGNGFGGSNLSPSASQAGKLLGALGKLVGTGLATATIWFNWVDLMTPGWMDAASAGGIEGFLNFAQANIEAKGLNGREKQAFDAIAENVPAILGSPHFSALEKKEMLYPTLVNVAVGINQSNKHPDFYRDPEGFLSTLIDKEIDKNPMNTPHDEKNAPRIQIQITSKDIIQKCDDLVMFDSDFTVKKQGDGYISTRPTVAGYIRVTGSETPLAVRLTNPGYQVDFRSQGSGNQGDYALNMTLPADGSWVRFNISGVKVSEEAGDVVIKASAIDKPALQATQRMTVFWFRTKLYTRVGEPYRLDHSRKESTLYGPPDDPNRPGRLKPLMTMRGEALLVPTLAIKDSCKISEIPQLSGLSVGFVQNYENQRRLPNGDVTAPSYRSVNYTEPEVAWSENATDGDYLIVPKQINSRHLPALPGEATVDSRSDTFPYYPIYPEEAERPEKLKPFLVDTSGKHTLFATISSEDSPSINNVAFHFHSSFDFDGKTLGSWKYTDVSNEDIEIKDNFRLWLVVNDASSDDAETITMVRETIWSLDVNSSFPDDQYIRPSPIDGGWKPWVMPVLDGESSNATSKKNASFTSSDETVRINFPNERPEND